MIFGAITESTRNVLGENPSEQGRATSAPTQGPPTPRPKPPGHGRKAAAAYSEGAHHRHGAVERDGLRLRPTALQPVRGGQRKVRCERHQHGRLAEIWSWVAVQPHRETAGRHGHPIGRRALQRRYHHEGAAVDQGAARRSARR